MLYCLCLRYKLCALFPLFKIFFNQHMLNTNLLRVSFRLETPEASVPGWSDIASAHSPLVGPWSCAGAAAEPGTDPSHPAGSCSETHLGRSWALVSTWNSPDFPTFVNLGAVEIAGFWLWLHWLFLLGPEESCISAQHYLPLFQLYCRSHAMFFKAAFLLGVLDLRGTPFPLPEFWASYCPGYTCPGPSSAAFSLQFLPVTSANAPIFRWLKCYIFSANHLIGAKCSCLRTLIVSATGLSSLAHLKLCTLRALKWKETSLLLMGSAFPSRADSSGWPTAAFL